MRNCFSPWPPSSPSPTFLVAACDKCESTRVYVPPVVACEPKSPRAPPHHPPSHHAPTSHPAPAPGSTPPPATLPGSGQAYPHTLLLQPPHTRTRTGADMRIERQPQCHHITACLTTFVQPHTPCAHNAQRPPTTSPNPSSPPHPPPQSRPTLMPAPACEAWPTADRR